jgi:hypothetical protein
MMRAIEICAGGDDLKRTKLLYLWLVYEEQEEFHDPTITMRVRSYMWLANQHLQDPTKPLQAVIEELNNALEASAIAASPTAPPVSAATPTGAPSAASPPGVAPATVPVATAAPISTPTATAAAALNAAAAAARNPDALSDTDKPYLIEGLMTRLGQPIKDERPVVTAIRSFLMDNLETRSQLKNLEAFLKSGEYSDEEDRMAMNNTPKALQKKLGKVTGKIAELDATIYQHRKALRKQANPKAIKKLTKKIGKAEAEKSQLRSQKKIIERAIERQKKKKTKDTEYYSNKPEKLLGMINLFFANEEVAEGETPNYEQVLADTQEQIDKARERGFRFFRGAYSVLNPLNYLLKPTLTGVLEAIVAKDDALKKIKPEYVAKLADSWRDPQGVKNWIRGLEGSEKEAMRTVVPVLIGHISHAVNAGGFASYLNTLSIFQAKGLVKQLENRTREFSLEHARETSGNHLDRFGAYLDLNNHICRESETVKAKEVFWHANKVIGIRTAKGLGLAAVSGGIGAGALALASLSGTALAAGGAATAGGVAMGSSLGVEDPKIKSFLRRNAVRGLAAGGLGALALGTVPWLAIPAMATGCLVPSIWQRREKIEGGMVKHGPGVVGGAAKGVGKIAYWGARGVWAYAGGVLSLLTLGRALKSPTYRNFFGMHTGPLFGKDTPKPSPQLTSNKPTRGRRK